MGYGSLGSPGFIKCAGRSYGSSSLPSYLKESKAGVQGAHTSFSSSWWYSVMRLKGTVYRVLDITPNEVHRIRVEYTFGKSPINPVPKPNSKYPMK